MRKILLSAIGLALWIVPTVSEVAQDSPASEDSFTPDSDAIEAVARQEAPILHFHPDEGEHCCYPSDPDDAYDRAKLGQTGKHKGAPLPGPLRAGLRAAHTPDTRPARADQILALV